jgi:hypothetical protein
MRKVTLSSYYTTELNSMAQRQKRTELIQSVDGCFHLARKALDEGKEVLSLYFLDKALKLDGNNSTLIRERAKVYIFLKMYTDVLEQVEYLLYLDPENEDAKNAKVLLEQRINYYQLVKAFPIYS